MADKPIGSFIPSKRLRKLVQYAFRRQVDGSNMFSHEEVTVDLPDEFFQGKRIEMPLCVHGHLIRADQELGGICDTCQRYLCIRCAQVCICALCGHLTCLECAIVRGEEIFCSREGFRRLLWHSIVGRNETTNSPTRAGTEPGVPVEPRPQRRIQR
jgi:hypothetical protein